MEQQSTNSLSFKHISVAANEAVKYIKDRKTHTINPLKTRWKKFNKACSGGLEPGNVITVAGASGTGKSAFVNTLESDLIDLNKGEDIVCLSFSFEMLSYRQVGRKLSNKLHQTTSELYSAETDLSDDSLIKVEKAADRIKKYPIYYVDTPGTVEEVGETGSVTTGRTDEAASRRQKAETAAQKKAEAKAKKEQAKNMTESEKMDVEIQRIKKRVTEINANIEKFQQTSELLEKMEERLDGLAGKLEN